MIWYSCVRSTHNNHGQFAPALRASAGRLTSCTLCAGRYAPIFAQNAHKVSRPCRGRYTLGAMKAFLLSLALLISSFQALAEESCERNVQDDGARKAAISFLSRQEYVDEYERYPESTIESGCFWIVSFKHKDWKTRKPSRGKVSVHKTTGETKWLPSR
ncbi:hypothetical protein FIU95_07835 [Microbulbifer sp. THAF38]|nr:hypothetical protein FIU95_07835 [Microbulbifer sp. THAF38]